MKNINSTPLFLITVQIKKTAVIIPLIFALISCKKNQEIVKVHYSKFYCEGECPVFDLVIYTDGRIIYKAIDFNKEKKGIYASKLSDPMLADFNSIVEATDWNSLENSYISAVLDSDCANIEFHYDNKEIKRINDCSEKSPDELGVLYDILNEIKTNSEWNNLQEFSDSNLIIIPQTE